MAIRLKPLDLSQIQTGSVRRRSYRLGSDHLAAMPDPTKPLREFYLSLPKAGASRRLLEAAQLMAHTALLDRPILWVIDGTLLQAGLSPQIVFLMRRGLVQGLIMSGEAALLDYELAFHGVTCEDREVGLADGGLGLTRETGEGINEIINEGVKRGFSVGECLGRGILDRRPRYYMNSVLATGAARLIPVSVHVSLGAEGFHRYPGADGAMLGKGSLKDSLILGSHLSSMAPGTLLMAAHTDAPLNHVLIHSFGLARNLNQSLKGLHLISIGDGVQDLKELPGLDQIHCVPGPIDLSMPLLLGALFSLIE